MNRKVKIAYEQLKSLTEFKEKHEDKLKLNALTWKMFEDSEVMLNRIEALLIEEDKNEKVATLEKNKTFEELETEGYILFYLLTSYGNYTNFIPFKTIEGCSKWELKKAPDIVVLTNLQTMKSTMDDHVAEVTEAGITPERKREFETLLLKADDLVNEPQKYRQQQTVVIDKQKEEMESFRNLLKNSLKTNIIANFSETDPDLVREFLDSIHVYSPKRRKRVLTGYMTNQNGEPVRNVWISIDGEKPVKRGGVRGNFFFYNISPGRHSIEFIKDSYVSITKNIVLEADKTLHLNIVFELVQALKDNEP